MKNKFESGETDTPEQGPEYKLSEQARGKIRLAFHDQYTNQDSPYEELKMLSSNHERFTKILADILRDTDIPETHWETREMGDTVRRIIENSDSQSAVEDIIYVLEGKDLPADYPPENN